MDIGYLRFCFRLWRRETAEKLLWKLAWMLPRSIALLAFVRVSSCTGEAPDDSYSRLYKAFKAGAGK